MNDSETLTQPKTNRSRTEVGRLAVQLLQSHELVEATHSESAYDVQFFATTESSDGMRPLLEPKTNRSRAEIGRAVFDLLDIHDRVWIGSSVSDYDVQIYADE